MIKLKDLLTESELGPKDLASNKLWRGILYLLSDLNRMTTVDTQTKRKIKAHLALAAKELDKDVGEGASMNEGPAMTDQEKKRTKARLHHFDRPKLVDMLRVAADAANRGNPRADDLAHIYRDELNSRSKGYDGV